MAASRIRKRFRPLGWLIALLALVTAITAAPASAVTPTVTLDRSSYVVGETVQVSYSGAQSNSWVAIYKASDPTDQEHYQTWQSTSGSSGSVSLTTDGLTAGTSYNVDLLGDSTSTYTVLAHVSLSVSSQPRAVSLDKTAYTQGNTITAAYSTTQSSSTNWIGIYPDSGVKPGSTQALVWAYAPNGSGSVTLSTTNLSPGGYLAYYLYNNGYTQIGRPIHFWVTDGTTISQRSSSIPSLSLDKATYAAGDTVTATYSMPSGAVPSGNDNWIGIYADSSPANSSYKAWNWARNASGTATLTLPTTLPTGGYTAYLLANTTLGDGTYSSHLNGSYYTIPVHFWVGSAPQGKSVPQLDHVFVVMMENRAYSDVIGSSSAPYLNSLAQSNVTLANSHGIFHPSDPNYVALDGAQTYISGNNFPGVTGGGIGSITSSHLGTLLDSASKTWKGYQDGMDGKCDLQPHYPYDPDNIPFVYFSGMKDTTYCQNHLQPMSQMWTDLQSASTTPNFVWFEPGTCYSMHSCGVSDGDTWMQNNIPTILNSPAFTQQKSLLIITWDEDANWTAANPIPTIVVGSSGLTKTGFTSNAWYNHYSVTRTIEDGLGLTHNMTSNDQNATPINDIWP